MIFAGPLPTDTGTIATAKMEIKRQEVDGKERVLIRFVPAPPQLNQ